MTWGGAKQRNQAAFFRFFVANSRHSFSGMADWRLGIESPPSTASNWATAPARKFTPSSATQKAKLQSGWSTTSLLSVRAGLGHQIVIDYRGEEDGWWFAKLHRTPGAVMHDNSEGSQSVWRELQSSSIEWPLWKLVCWFGWEGAGLWGCGYKQWRKYWRIFPVENLLQEIFEPQEFLKILEDNFEKVL